ncbi:MAG: hypothetical protein GQ546_04040 [Gammaproteobacteria bacterium]|nr:hypothetical protein [Gammaproteobacteria bacterium]
MLNRKFSLGLTASIIAALPFAVTEVSAEAGLDGSSDIVCAVMDVVACAEDKGCVQNTARGFELPEFIILDSKKKFLRAAYETGHKAVSPVKNFEQSGAHFIMQGVENGRGWNIAIDTKNGTMSGSAVGDAVSFLVFGTCTTL